MTTANTNSRASLLAGLRTGGVRSSALDTSHTASTATFNFHRLSTYQPTSFSEEDQVNEIFHQNISQDRDVPKTAAVDGPNHFSHHQAARGMNPNSVPFSPGFAPNVPQAQIQMHILQLEMMRFQVCCMLSSMSINQSQMVIF